MEQSIENLPPEQRAQRYRKLAKDALRKAQKASDPDRQAEYFSMASSWHAMASEMERLASGSASSRRAPRDDEQRVR